LQAPPHPTLAAAAAAAANRIFTLSTPRKRAPSQPDKLPVARIEPGRRVQSTRPPLPHTCPSTGNHHSSREPGQLSRWL